jgi:tetratricopeptide (TPR) repeat protein
MAKIPLRTYNREIEGMIDRGQAAQAISHGRHILKFFPKHIDTYRLLGKAFLELQRYAEAADVLERVLACVPDDFISQIGMGIIREDEGNLDAALWHMERAFEAQPSNVGVQEELRRLHGRRDGVEPAKIRLTRGALVRMYARGELFQQAIDEARAALAEDPQRTDLEVILARMYFLSGQKVSATEVCTRLITKLPFCFESNQILAEILPGTSREEDAKLYLQRVFAMDPYLEHLKPPAISSSEVPDNAVELEHLEWLSEQETGQPPEWTKTLGAGWEDQAEPVPEWITGAQFEPKSEEPLIPPPGT